MALTLDALNRLEGTMGVPLMEIEMDPSQIVKRLDAWIWSALDDADREEVSAQEIRQMIHLGNLAELLHVVSGLVRASLPENTEGKTTPAPQKVRRAVAGKS